MKIHVLIMLALLSLAGCTTTYKGQIKGDSDQGASKNVKEVARQSGNAESRP